MEAVTRYWEDSQRQESVHRNFHCHHLAHDFDQPSVPDGSLQGTPPLMLRAGPCPPCCPANADRSWAQLLLSAANRPRFTASS